MTKEEAGLHEIDMLVRLHSPRQGQHPEVDMSAPSGKHFSLWPCHQISLMSHTTDAKCMMASVMWRGTACQQQHCRTFMARTGVEGVLLALLQDMLVKQIEGHTICALGDAGRLAYAQQQRVPK
jgi:hypothetical protein